MTAPPREMPLRAVPNAGCPGCGPIPSDATSGYCALHLRLLLEQYRAMRANAALERRAA